MNPPHVVAVLQSTNLHYHAGLCPHDMYPSRYNVPHDLPWCTMQHSSSCTLTFSRPGQGQGGHVYWNTLYKVKCIENRIRNSFNLIRMFPVSSLTVCYIKRPAHFFLTILFLNTRIHWFFHVEHFPSQPPAQTTANNISILSSYTDSVPLNSHHHLHPALQETFQPASPAVASWTSCGGHLTTMTDKNWGLSKQFRPTLVRQSPASLVAQVLPQPPARLHTIASPTFCTLSSISSSSHLQEPLQRIERYTKHPLLISGVITSALRQSWKLNMLRQTLHCY